MVGVQFPDPIVDLAARVRALRDPTLLAEPEPEHEEVAIKTEAKSTGDIEGVSTVNLEGDSTISFEESTMELDLDEYHVYHGPGKQDLTVEHEEYLTSALEEDLAANDDSELVVKDKEVITTANEEVMAGNKGDSAAAKEEGLIASIEENAVVQNQKKTHTVMSGFGAASKRASHPPPHLPSSPSSSDFADGHEDAEASAVGSMFVQAAEQVRRTRGEGSDKKEEVAIQKPDIRKDSIVAAPATAPKKAPDMAPDTGRVRKVRWGPDKKENEVTAPQTGRVRKVRWGPAIDTKAADEKPTSSPTKVDEDIVVAGPVNVL